jgi:hypothetical protein
MDNSFLRFAGDVSLRKVEIRSLNGQIANIVNQVESIEIYEDIFAPFITASIVVRESVDYINLFPFLGEEFVHLDITTPTLEIPISGRFYIYKITDRLYTKEREVVYTIKCASEEFIADINTKISKGYSGQPSEIASQVLTKDGLFTQKRTIIEESGNRVKFTSNFWSPVKCLNYLSTISLNKNKSPSYLFFENRDGFNFRSIDEILKSDTYHKFIKDNYTRDVTSEQSTSSSQNITEDYKRILEFEVPVLTDYLKSTQGGYIKSRIISHNILTKKYTVKNYSIKEDTNYNTLLNRTPAYSKHSLANSAATMLNFPTYFSNFSNTADSSSYKFIQKRMAFFQQLEKYKIHLSAFGRTDYTVGQVVELTIPKATQITAEDAETKDMVLSGRYLISAINHTITRENHICNMELIKNSILTDLTKY